MGKKNIRNGEGYCEMGKNIVKWGRKKMEMGKNIVLRNGEGKKWKWGRILY